LKREDIKRNLNDLIKIEWVNENKLVNVMYGINQENDYVRQLTIFFHNVGYID
jgi:hypothetical protein